MDTPPHSCKRRRFPPAIIAHAIWLYCRFNLSLRGNEKTFLWRRVDVSYETIRRWAAQFGPSIARGLQSLRPRQDDTWQPDEVVVSRSPSADGEALIISEAKRKSITRKSFSADDIMGRILKCLQSEAQLILSEGIANSAADIDIVMVNACGFPRWLGGPLHLLNADEGTATG